MVRTPDETLVLEQQSLARLIINDVLQYGFYLVKFADIFTGKNKKRAVEFHP
jgi:hypothetical protein